MNYATLVSTVQGYVENEFDTDLLNTMIRQAESRIANAVMLPAFRRNVTGSLTASNQFLACPTDFLAPYSLTTIDPLTGAYTSLLMRKTSFIRECYPIPTDTGAPRFYALFGPPGADPKELTFLVGPTPDAGYAVELHYYCYPESIVTAGTTWIGDNFDTVLLYGVLVEAYTVLKGETELLSLYNTKYNEALTQLKQLDENMTHDAYRTTPARN